jgi:hypothetical protein
MGNVVENRNYPTTFCGTTRHQSKRNISQQDRRFHKWKIITATHSILTFPTTQFCTQPAIQIMQVKNSKVRFNDSINMLAAYRLTDILGFKE